MDRALLAWNTLRETPGLGPKGLVLLAQSLIEAGRTASDLLGASTDALVSLGIRGRVAEKAARALSDPLTPAAPPDGVRILCPDDDQYPLERLDAKLPLPVILYAAGDLSLLRERGLAISGSRSASEDALTLADRVATAASRAELNVVSGHAAGIDETAHRAALAAGGTTTIVIAEGMTRFALKPSLRTYDPDRMLVLSEFAPDAPWTRINAMRRNATIAALAEAVVVVAAGTAGGSWAQAEMCLKAEKPLFVPDFSSEIAAGNHILIDRGAIRLEHAEQAVSYVTTGVGSSPAQLGLLG